MATAGGVEGLVPDDLARADEWTQQRAVVAVVGGFVTDTEDLGAGDAARVASAHRVLPPAPAGFAGAALLDRDHVAVVTFTSDQLVDQPGRRRAGPGDQRRADAVDVDGRRGQRGDGVLVEVAGDDDAGGGGAERVELRPDLAGQRHQVAGVQAHRTEVRPGDADAG